MRDLLGDCRIRDVLTWKQHHRDALHRIEDVDGSGQDAERLHGGAHRTVAVMWQSGEYRTGIAIAAPLVQI